MKSRWNTQWYSIQKPIFETDITDEQNALRREFTFKVEIVLEIGVAGVNIYSKITILTLSDVVARLARSVRPWRIFIDFYQ